MPPAPPDNTHGSSPEDLREFHWLIHDTCNYCCPYCPRSGGNRAQGPRKDNPRTAETWAAAWRRVHAAYGRCRVYITGGEPTLFPGFVGLVGELGGMHSVVFDTNLSWSRGELELFCGRISPGDVKVNLSFHPNTAAADEFIAKALLLRERGFGASCRIVAFPPLLPEIAGYCDKFEEAGLGLAVTPFRGPYSGKKYPREYTEGERARIAALNARLGPEQAGTGPQAGIMRRILYPRMVPPRGQACRSGQVYCCVEHDGTAYRCMQYANRAMEPMGCILDGDFRLAGGPSPCGLMYCEYERRYLVAFAGRGPHQEPPRP